MKLEEIAETAGIDVFYRTAGGRFVGVRGRISPSTRGELARADDYSQCSDGPENEAGESLIYFQFNGRSREIPYVLRSGKR